MYRKLVQAATRNSSFSAAVESLAEQAELSIGIKRLWRATKRIGEERVAEEQAATAAYQALPLPQQQTSPVEQVPQVVSVQMDGGRLQIRARNAEGDKSEADCAEEPATFWRELKAGCLLSMQSQVHAEDPCPRIPATFVDSRKMREIAKEIKGFSSEGLPSAEAEEVSEPVCRDRPGRPQPLVRSVVAMVSGLEEFGVRLASAAYARGFAAAPRKAFLADGAESNWSVWRTWFSHYTPIVDFVHALMYVYAAAMAGCPPAAGWARYRQWAQWLWGGQVALVIGALTERQQELGQPEKEETGTPRAQVAQSLGYLTNQQSRMKYDEYRRQGLPITSNYVESTIKQINRRMKGTEKFWSGPVNAMLALVADHLSETNVVADFWRRRNHRLTQQPPCQQAL